MFKIVTGGSAANVELQKAAQVIAIPTCFLILHIARRFLRF